MGVPSFFRWLVKKYPKIVTDAIEQRSDDTIDRTDLYDIGTIDMTQSNINGFETDNLYLDMNGIIHPCTHPEDGSSPHDESIMIYTIFQYIDRIFNIVRPRQLLYMAIDGVAPRAKMNQQRQRRFRAAREIYDKQQIENKLRAEWLSQGKSLPEKSIPPWDTSAITPGTPFMYKLADALKYYIQLRITTNPAWQSIKIIFSDSNVPGEGEHKLMKYIRLQRAQSDYNPNTSHCFYGMDADLIMLGLASHEPYFRIIRECITESTVTMKCGICNRTTHWTSDCTGEEPLADNDQHDIGAPDKSDTSISSTIFGKPFQFLHLNILREYLSYDLYVDPLTLPWCTNGIFSIERAIDDFVFLCFFVGNDFLPHLPTLEIREGAIDALVYLYKKYLPKMNGYITDSGHVDLSRASMIMSDISALEDEIYQRRKHKQQRQQQQRDDAQVRVDKIRADNKIRELAEKKYASTVDKQQLNVLGAKNYNTNNSSISSSGPQANLTAAAKLKALLAKHTGKRAADHNQNNTSNNDNVDTSTTTQSTDTNSNTAPPYQLKHVKPVTLPPAKKIKTDYTVLSDDEPKDGQTNHENNNDTTVDSAHHTETMNSELVQSELLLPMKSADTAIDIDTSTNTAVDDNDDDDDSSSDKDEEEKKLAPVIHVKQQAELQYAKQFKEYMKPINEPIQSSNDTINYGELGWKQRYYAEKLHIDPNTTHGESILNSMFESYACGLSWVLLYYYEDCASWSWYYPFHYSPMASNLTQLGKYQPIKFIKSTPFKPFDQLLGVLPAQSAHNVPAEYAKLMTDPNSPLHDQYPIDFELDMNGKKYAWQAIALLPWIDENKLLHEARKAETSLDELEKIRNSHGNELLYVHTSHPLANVMKSLYDTKDIQNDGTSVKQTLDHTIGGISGTIETYDGYIPPGNKVTCKLTINNQSLPSVESNQSISVFYHLPPFTPHRPELLPGLILPDTVLTSTDLDEQQRGGGRKGFLLNLLQPNSYHNNNKRYNQYEQPWQSNANTGSGVYNQPYQNNQPQHSTNYNHNYTNTNNNNKHPNPCIYYQKHGNCNRGDACKFSHIPSAQSAVPANQPPPPQQYNNYQSYNVYQQPTPSPHYNQYQQYNAYNQPPLSQQQYNGYITQQPLLQYAQPQYTQPPQFYPQFHQQQPSYPYPPQSSSSQSYNMLPGSSSAGSQQPQPYSFQHPTYQQR